MKCNTCGVDVPPGNPHCSQCGTPIQHTSKQPPSSKQTSSTTAIIISAVLVLVVVISIFALISMDQSPNDGGDGGIPPEKERCTVDFTIQNEQEQRVVYSDVGKIVYFSSPQTVDLINTGWSTADSPTDQEYADVNLTINEEDNYIRYGGTIYVEPNDFIEGGGYTYRIIIRVSDSDGNTIDSYSGTIRD